MKSLRSILELLNQFKSKALVIECEQYWHQAQRSADYPWLLLALMIILSVSSLFWAKARLQESSQLSQMQHLVQTMRVTTREPLELGSKRLMGTPSAKSMIAEHVQIQAILFNQDPKQREVLLTDSSGMVKTYKIGDLLPGGSEVIAIEPQSITIQREGITNQFRMNQYPSSFISDQPLQQKNTILQ